MKYGVWQNIKYRLNYEKYVVHLQADLMLIPEPENIEPLFVKELDKSSDQELLQWAAIVSEAYNDGVYTLESARKHIFNHLFLDITNVYFVMDGNEPVGTISIGRFKSNRNVGGDARIAIKRQYQGRGLGKFVISYGFTQLRHQGLKYGESVISIPRSPSIVLHYLCGFFPQYKKEYFVFNVQKRYWIVRWKANRKLRKLYNSYIDDISKKITVKK